MPAASAQPLDARSLVDRLLNDAMARNASDIHIEPERHQFAVQLRVDGLLAPYDTLDRAAGTSVVSRLMVMAELLTYRQDIPQEGRLQFGTGDQMVAMRVSVMPTTRGLRAVVRLPAELSQPRSLDGLDLNQRVLEGLKKFARRDAGMLLLTGPAGSGKTTTIGKLAARYKAEGRAVMLVAGDTFRAAAVAQLKIWGERTGCPVIARDDVGADAAGLAFDALQSARAQNIDVLLIDTAGRLQNKAHLMDELIKIDRVLKKIDAAAPHTRLLVLDATTGQNAVRQAEEFTSAIDVTGLFLAKLDGTAKGGVIIADRKSVV